MEDARRNFFRNVKAFQAKERPKAFDPMDLFPGESEGQVADNLAKYFNRISCEFDPLEPADIPRTHSRKLPVLLPYQVEGRIRAFKKPKSMVKGDIFPVLMDKFATLLAIPLTSIYNEITSTSVWPAVWKQEFVTVIPKCRAPAGLGDLRNISCTMLASKIYESFVLNWLASEVSCKENQYGGIKGCGVNHFLVDMWDEICCNLEDARASMVITAVDYAKAFNRLSFQHCLRAFARKGASTETISLLATFLSNRTMSVRVNNTWSAPLPVHGGVPQGSILGVLLFNISTDDLEDDQEDDRAFYDSSDPPPLSDSSSKVSDGPPANQSGNNAALLGPSTLGPDSSSAVSEGPPANQSWNDTAMLGSSTLGSSGYTSSEDEGDGTLPSIGPPAVPSSRPVPTRVLNPMAAPFFPRSTYAPSADTLNITDVVLDGLDAELTRDSIYSREVPLLGPDAYGAAAEKVNITDELLACLANPSCTQASNCSPDHRLALSPSDPSTPPPSPVCLSLSAPPSGTRGPQESLDSSGPDCPNSPSPSSPDSSGPGPTTQLISTPVDRSRGRPRLRCSPVRSRGPRLSARDWSYLPGRRNRLRRRNLHRKIINYTDEGEITVPEEKNKKKTGLRWKRKRPRTLKYMDDGMSISKANMDSAAGSVVEGKLVKDKHDIESQNLFRRVVRKAQSRGMVVNSKKTKILCISDAQTYKAAAHIMDSEGSRLSSGTHLKVLGFHLDSRPSVHAHVEALRLRMRDTVWVLRHLKIAGFTEPELAVVYRTVIRPVLDYCAVVYHPMLNDEQDQAVERMQAQALKCIYGYKDSYAVMREKAGVPTHRARRIELCDTFAEKAARSARFQSWFPLRTARSGRRGEEYQEFQARTDRLYNSPLYYFRRRLNGKPGKTYGERNRRYRE